MTYVNCNCPDPPGGSIQCDPDQMGFCYFENGKVERVCKRPVDTLDELVLDDLALVNWAYNEVTKTDLALNRYPTSYELAILESGTYSDGSMVVNFALPQNIKDALEQLKNNDTDDANSAFDTEVF